MNGDGDLFGDDSEAPEAEVGEKTSHDATAAAAPGPIGTNAAPSGGVGVSPASGGTAPMGSASPAREEEGNDEDALNKLAAARLQAAARAREAKRRGGAEQGRTGWSDDHEDVGASAAAAHDGDAAADAATAIARGGGRGGESRTGAPSAGGAGRGDPAPFVPAAAPGDPWISSGDEEVAPSLATDAAGVSAEVDGSCAGSARPRGAAEARMASADKRNEPAFGRGGGSADAAPPRGLDLSGADALNELAAARLQAAARAREARRQAKALREDEVGAVPTGTGDTPPPEGQGAGTREAKIGQRGASEAQATDAIGSTPTATGGAAEAGAGTAMAAAAQAPTESGPQEAAIVPAHSVGLGPLRALGGADLEAGQARTAVGERTIADVGESHVGVAADGATAGGDALHPPPPPSGAAGGFRSAGPHRPPPSARADAAGAQSGDALDAGRVIASAGTDSNLEEALLTPSRVHGSLPPNSAPGTPRGEAADFDKSAELDKANAVLNGLGIAATPRPDAATGEVPAGAVPSLDRPRGLPNGARGPPGPARGVVRGHPRGGARVSAPLHGAHHPLEPGAAPLTGGPRNGGVGGGGVGRGIAARLGRPARRGVLRSAVDPTGDPLAVRRGFSAAAPGGGGGNVGSGGGGGKLPSIARHPARSPAQAHADAKSQGHLKLPALPAWTPAGNHIVASAPPSPATAKATPLPSPARESFVVPPGEATRAAARRVRERLRQQQLEVARIPRPPPPAPSAGTADATKLAAKRVRDKLRKQRHQEALDKQAAPPPPPKPDVDALAAAAKARLTEYKKREAKRMLHLSEREARRDEQLRADIEAMAAERQRRLQEMEAERLREQDEARARRVRERAERLEMQRRLRAEEAARKKAAAASGAPARPLYVRMQDEFAHREEEEAQAREAALAELRARAQPPDYEAMRKEASEHDMHIASVRADAERRHREEVPRYFVGRARGRVVEEDKKVAHRFRDGREQALELQQKKQRYARLVEEIFHRDTKESGADSGTDGGRAGGVDGLGVEVDWGRLHALEAEAALRAASVSELEAEAAGHGHYLRDSVLDRCERQTEMSHAYIEAIRAKLELHSAIPDLSAMAAM